MILMEGQQGQGETPYSRSGVWGLEAAWENSSIKGVIVGSGAHQSVDPAGLGFSALAAALAQADQGKDGGNPTDLAWVWSLRPPSVEACEPRIPRLLPLAA